MRRGKWLRLRMAAVAVLTIQTATVCAGKTSFNRALGDQKPDLSIPLNASGTYPTGSSETRPDASKPAVQDKPASGIKLPELSQIGDSAEETAPVFDSPLTGFSRVDGEGRRSGRALWVDDERKQLKGLGLSITPRQGARRTVSVETAYLHQRHSAGNGQASSARNNVWGLSLNGRFWGDTLHLGGDYAASWRYLAPSDNAGITDTASGNAYDLRLRFGPGPVSLGDHPLSWQLSMNRSVAQRSFWTPGDAPAGEVVERMTSSVDWGRINARFDYTRSQPRDGGATSGEQWQRRRYRAHLNYAGHSLDWVPLAGSVLGTPRYTVSLERRHATDAGVSSWVDTTAIMARFDPGPWQWQLGHTHSVDYGSAGVPITDRNLTTLQMHWPVDSWLALQPAVRWDVHEDQRGHGITRTTAGTLAGTAELIPNSLNASFNINAEHYQSELDDTSRRLSTIESSIDWLLWPQRGSSPRMSLSIDGRMQFRDQSGDTGNDADRYRAFASFKATWPDA